MRGTPEERFSAKVMPEPNSGCWLWTAAVDLKGYGKFWNGDRLVGAHRFSYEFHNGPIPEGLHIDHLCSVTCCVNPEHLEAVTPRENCQRTVDRGRNGQSAKTHCPAGHPYAGDNLYTALNGDRAFAALATLGLTAHIENVGPQEIMYFKPI